MSQHDPDHDLTPDDLHEIERSFHPELAFCLTGRAVGEVISVALVAMSVYHF